jgi:hypothetical protein
MVFAWGGCAPTDPQGNTNSNGNQNDNSSEPTGPEPVSFTDPQPAAAKVVLPEGVVIDASTLVVATNVGDAAIGSNGVAAVEVITDFPSLALLVDADDKTVLMAFVSPGDVAQEISARSTATALLFFSLGAWGVPAENAQDILDRIAASEEGATLAAAIAAAMVQNPTAITDGDQGVTDALMAAAQSLITEDSSPAAKSGVAARTLASNFQLLVTPDANTIQSGVQVLQNPDGDGVIAQNNFRRRAKMYAYLTGTKDDGGALTPVDPPTQTGEPVFIPTTYSLGLFSSFKQAAQNLVGEGGVAPWSPIRTGALVLPRQGSAAETIYSVIVLGPHLNVAGPSGPFTDARFATFYDEWNKTVGDLAMQTFVEDFVFKVLEFIAVAGPATANAQAAEAAVARFRLSLDPLLLAKGMAIPLSTKLAYRQALHEVLVALAQPDVEGAFRPKTIAMLQELWGQNSASKVKLEQLERNLGRAVRIGALLTAIDAALSALDLGAVFNDLSSSRPGDAWEATVVPRKVNLEPSSSTVTKNNLTVSLTASVQQVQDGEFLFRWSTTGGHGRIHSYLGQEGTTFDTKWPEDEIFYLGDFLGLVDGLMDTVTVEVYENDGSGTISSSTAFIGSATATINGRTTEETGPKRYFIASNPAAYSGIPQNTPFCYTGGLSFSKNGTTFFGGTNLSKRSDGFCTTSTFGVTVDLAPGDTLDILLSGLGPDVTDAREQPLCYYLDPIYIFTQTNDFKLDRVQFIAEGFEESCGDMSGTLREIHFVLQAHP